MAINMRNYQNGAGKRTVHCGLCRTPGHNRTNCPMIEPWAKEYEEWEDGAREAVLSDAWLKRQAYSTREAKRARSEAPRAKPACGFCRSTSHNRRNCTEMEQWRKKLTKANIRWRKAYAKFARERGCAPGSLLEVSYQEYEYKVMEYVDRSEVVLVDNALPENLSIFCAAEAWEVRQDHNVPIVGTSSMAKSGIPVQWFINGSDNDIALAASSMFSSARYNRWAGGSGSKEPEVKVLKLSDYQFTDEWITQLPADIDFVLKKLTLEKLQQFRLDALIDKWK
jgi:hypothetical protein